MTVSVYGLEEQKVFCVSSFCLWDVFRAGTRFSTLRGVHILTISKGEKPLVHRMTKPDGQPLDEPVNLRILIQPVTDNIPSVEALVEKYESAYPTLENLIQVLRLLKTLSKMDIDAFVSTPPLTLVPRI